MIVYAPLYRLPETERQSQPGKQNPTFVTGINPNAFPSEVIKRLIDRELNLGEITPFELMAHGQAMRRFELVA
jgi:hypothetical protein